MKCNKVFCQIGLGTTKMEEQGTSDGRVRTERDAERAWKYRCHAAAIYLQQGADNEKFSTHPVSHRALPAYVMVHNKWFYLVDLAASLLLLALALIEHPSVFLWPNWVPIHTLLELLCLFIICLELGVKVQWLGIRNFMRHKRTLVKSIVLVVMFVEAVVVLVRNRSHFRITRSLRPIFLIDSHHSYNVSIVLVVMFVEAVVVLVRNRSHFRITRSLRPIFLIDSHHSYNVSIVLVVMFVEAVVVLVRNRSHFRITRSLRPIFLIDSHHSYNVRRFVRQTLLSIPAVLDMLLLLLTVMFVFSILGFFFFRHIDPDYFGDPFRSFVSLFVLLTTANNPDVMMKAYEKWRFNAVFFILYTCIELYFVMNLLLAVVYDTFASNEKGKFRKLYLHKREAAERALELLQDRSSTNKGVKIEHFIGMLSFLGRFTNLRDMYLCFQSVNTSGSGRISEEEFLNVYDVLDLKWKKETLSSSAVPDFIHTAQKQLGKFVQSRYFTWPFYFANFLTGVWYFIETFLKFQHVNLLPNKYLAVSVFFCSLFSLELVLKMLGLGPRLYIRSGWNIYDLCVTVGAVAGVCLTRVDHPLTHIIILRFLSLFKLLRVKRSYRHIFDTISILVPRFTSAGIVLMVLYYFFAIIGMEIFSGYTDDLKNCCNDTLVASEFIYDVSKNQTYGYYLNSFHNILISFVTLWDLMVVNNWFIIMEGFTSVTGWKVTRLYFMFYFLVMMVVLTIVVAFILEGFLFRIQCSRVGDDSERPYKEVKLRLSKTEVDLLCARGTTITDAEFHSVRAALANEEMEEVEFQGFRWKDRADFSAQLYASEIQSWISAAEEARRSPSVSSHISRVSSD